MQPKPYDELTDLELCALCVWREARGESYLGKRSVMHVIWNRAQNPGWWGHDARQVVLKPYQFSSFNENDPNSKEWPTEEKPADWQAWVDALAIANAVLSRDPSEQNDLTQGAVFYFSPPLTEPPHTWGAVDFTVKIGNLSFYKQVPRD